MLCLAETRSFSFRPSRTRWIFHRTPRDDAPDERLFPVLGCYHPITSFNGISRPAAAFPDQPGLGHAERNQQVSSEEEKGFEPLVPLGTAVFKTAALDHSATPPGRPQASTDGSVSSRFYA